jgi:hypothetical protein
MASRSTSGTDSRLRRHSRAAALITWCDGKWNLAEVIRLIEFEHGPMDFNSVKYFKFLAPHRYVDLAAAPPEVAAGAEPGPRRKADAKSTARSCS